MAMELRTIDQVFITNMMYQAAESPRRRAIYRLHEHHEPVQRMINAILPGSYIPPHKHEDPDKVELFAILTGRAACLRFDNTGIIDQVVVLDADGPNRVVDIPPRTWHTLVALTPSALVEIIQGPYEASTHKRFAPWAPQEDMPGAAEYLRQLEAAIQACL